MASRHFSLAFLLLIPILTHLSLTETLKVAVTPLRTDRSECYTLVPSPVLSLMWRLTVS